MVLVQDNKKFDSFSQTGMAWLSEDQVKKINESNQISDVEEIASWKKDPVTGKIIWSDRVEQIQGEQGELKKSSLEPRDPNLVTQESSDRFNLEMKTGIRDKFWRLVEDKEEEVPTPETEPTQITVEPTPEPEVPVEEEVPEEPKPITDIAWFKDAGWTFTELSELITNRYWTEAEQVWDTLVWEINWERFQWTIDEWGNPIRKKIGRTDSAQESFANANWIQYDVNKDWTLTFQPDNIDQAIDLFDQFWPNVKIDPNNTEAIRATKAYETYSKYKWAPVDTYVQGFKNNEIGVWWETWDRLVKMNGWQPTAEMIQAREEWEQSTKVTNINDTWKVIAWEKVESTTKKNQTNLENLDTDYIKSVNSVLWDLANNYTEFKNGNTEINSIQSSLTNTSAKIDELQVEKRKVMDNIRKRHPNLPLSQQLAIADQELDAIDDQLFVLQRQENVDFSTYQYKNEQLKWEFEFKANQANVRLDLLWQMYGIQRGDVIRQQDIERQDQLIADEIERAEEARKQALIAWDAQMAKKFSYELALAEAKSSLNKSSFQFTTPQAWVIAKMNPQTWDVEFITVEEWEITPKWIPSIPTTWTQEAITTWTGQVTQQYWATSPVTTDNVPLASWQTWTPWVDIDWAIWDPIQAFASWTVVALQEPNESGWFGRRMVIEDDEGRLHVYNHLQSAAWDTNVWKRVERGQVIASMWNTGTVIAWEGWDGSHLDYRVSDNWDFSLKGGNWIDPNQFIGGQVTWLWVQPWSLEEDALIFNIGKSLFGSRVSDTEWARVTDFVKKWVAEWMEVSDIIDQILFFQPTDNKELWQVFKDTLISNNVDLSDFDMRRLWDLLSQGKLSSATKKVEDAILSQARTSDPDWFVSERLTRSMSRRADDLITKITALENTDEWRNNPIWSFEWTIEQWLGRFKSPEATELKNDATRLVSDFRLKNLGSAVTPTEEEFLDWVLPKLFDSTINFKIKVNSFKDQALWELNDFRQDKELPMLDTNSLFDRDVRAGLYTWEVTPMDTTLWQDDLFNEWKSGWTTINSEWVF